MLVQFVKFGIVGVSNTLLTFAVYTLLLKVFGVWYLAASAIGFVVGATNGFLLNRRWTFRGHVGDALTPVRWAIVQGCGLALNLGLLYLFVHDAGLDKLARPGGRDRDRDRHHLLRQPRVDVPRAPARSPLADGDGGRRRRASAATRLSGRRRAARGRRGCARRGRSAPPRARAGARAAS